jgi:LEA14-like dessication related protein
MNPLIVIALIAGGGWLLNTFLTAGTAESLNYLIEDVSFSITGIIHLETVITIGIQNPSSHSLTINSMVGTVYVNGDYLGNVSNFTQTTVLQNAQTSYSIHFVSDVFNLSTELLNIIQNYHGLTLRLVGDININGSLVPLDLTYKVL